MYAARLYRGGHTCVVFDVNPDSVAHLILDGAVGACSLDEFIEKLDQPRAIWLMVPAGEPTEQLVRTLAERLAVDDAIIDGGNSYFKDDIRRATPLQLRGIHFACEGGHADFAPRNELEIELLRYLLARFGHVSYERVLFGSSLSVRTYAQRG